MKQEIKNFNLKIKGQGQLINNDCLAGMKNLPDNSIDLVLTDPLMVSQTRISVHGSGLPRTAGRLSQHKKLGAMTSKTALVMWTVSGIGSSLS